MSPGYLGSDGRSIGAAGKDVSEDVSKKDGIGTRIKGSAPLRALGRRAVAALDERERRAEAQPAGARPGAWALSRLRLLETVPEREFLALEPGADMRSLAKRRMSLLDESDARVWVVLEGGAKLCRLGLGGRRLVEAILGIERWIERRLTSLNR
jgi:hypothetical protein